MSDLREAAEMALKFIVVSSAKDKAWYTTEEFELVSALRQALAQPEQEPVAWITDGGKGELGWRKTTEKDIPLYTAPPKREWIGLSSLDKTLLRTAYAQVRQVVTDWDGFFAAIDTKLKEKNNG